MTTALHPELAGLLRDVLESPREDRWRLVFADWCEENGLEARAEFIRVQIELAKQEAWLAKHDPRGEFYSTHPVVQWVERMRDRCRSLTPCNGRWYSDVLKAASDWRYSRGFVAEITLSLDAFLKHAEALFSAHPITAVCLTDRSPSHDDAGWHWSRARRLQRPSVTTGLAGAGLQAGDMVYLGPDGRLHPYRDADGPQPPPFGFLLSQTAEGAEVNVMAAGEADEGEVATDYLPPEVYRLLEPANRDFGDLHAYYVGRDEALADASYALVSLGRSRAGLPALPRPVVHSTAP